MGPHTEDTRKANGPMERPAFEVMNVIVLTGLLVTAMAMAIGFGSPAATVAVSLVLFAWYYAAPSMFMSSTNRRDYWEDEQLKCHPDKYNIRTSRFYREPRKFKRLRRIANARNPDYEAECCPACGERGTVLGKGKYVIRDPKRLLTCECRNVNCERSIFNMNCERWEYKPHDC